MKVLRGVKESDFVGKTIKSIEHAAVNYIVFTFTDDTTVEMWADGSICTQYGIIPGLFVEEKEDA